MYQPILSFYIILLVSASMMIGVEHKIVIQVSPPRCLSTASLRAWQARGDFQVMNEPFISAFILQDENSKNITEQWWRADAPLTFDVVHQKILQMAQAGPVFVKEESFVVKTYLESNPSLLYDPNVYFVFLIRNPHHSVSSFYKGHGRVTENFSYYAGFQPCYEVFEMVQQLGMNRPILLHAEDLYTQPYEITQQLCAALDIPFLENMLEWDNLGSSFTGIQEWHELKNPELTHRWHGAAIRSTRFHRPNEYEVDEQGEPTFAEIAHEADRAACMEAYYANKKYYDLLCDQKSEFLTVK